MENAPRPNLVGSPKIDFQSSEKKKNKNKEKKGAGSRCIPEKKEQIPYSSKFSWFKNFVKMLKLVTK